MIQFIFNIRSGALLFLVFLFLSSCSKLRLSPCGDEGFDVHFYPFGQEDEAVAIVANDDGYAILLTTHSVVSGSRMTLLKVSPCGWPEGDSMGKQYPETADSSIKGVTAKGLYFDKEKQEYHLTGTIESTDGGTAAIWMVVNNKDSVLHQRTSTLESNSYQAAGIVRIDENKDMVLLSDPASEEPIACWSVGPTDSTNCFHETGKNLSPIGFLNTPSSENALVFASENSLSPSFISFESESCEVGGPFPINQFDKARPVALCRNHSENGFYALLNNNPVAGQPRLKIIDVSESGRNYNPIPIPDGDLSSEIVGVDIAMGENGDIIVLADSVRENHNTIVFIGIQASTGKVLWDRAINPGGKLTQTTLCQDTRGQNPNSPNQLALIATTDLDGEKIITFMRMDLE